jgi:membrane fusion protein, multidrug efflux system
MTVSPAITERLARHRRRLPLLFGLAMIAVLAVGYGVWQHLTQNRSAAPEPPAPVPVIAATVKEQNFPIVLTGIGNVTALNSATVRSLVTEQILSIDFKDGQFVNKGQLLAQLDPSTYQAQLDQAEANLARDEAHLENGRINLGRYIPLQNKALRQSNRSPRSKR